MARIRHLLFDEYVLSSEDYRCFLNRSFEVLKEKKRNFSYAFFAKNAGFKSRGFIVDVIKGRKSLTLDSAQKVVRGLGIGKKSAELFYLMVANDKEPSFERQNRIGKIRQNLISDASQEQKAQLASESFYSSPTTLIVYASLGELTSGASLAEIVTRSQLDVKQVLQTLDTMIKMEIVEQRVERYFAVNSKVVFKEIGENKVFQKLFLNSLKMATQNVNSHFADKNKFFFHSVVSLQKSQLAELRTRLEETITEFVHEAQDDSGDHVATVQLSFF